jgi:hypothetical protein
MMTRLTQLLIFALLIIGPGLYAQNDSLNASTGNIYKDLSKNLDIKDAKFILIMNNDQELIDTSMLKKIDPDWLEKVNILTLDPNQSDSKISTVEIYIRKKYVGKAKKVIDKK